MLVAYLRTLTFLAAVPLAVATVAAQQRPLPGLVDALDRTRALTRDEQSLGSDSLTRAAGIACERLNELAGDRLNALLESAYDNLHEHYDEAKRLVERSRGEGAGQAGALRETLRASGAGADDAAALVERLETARAGGESGVIVSYSVPLHVDELAKRVCEVYRWRHDQDNPDEPADRQVVNAALDGLVGLALIAAGDELTAAQGEQAAAVAGTATAVGSVIVAAAYRDLYR